MSDKDKKEIPTMEKSNMTEPQEEFIADMARPSVRKEETEGGKESSSKSPPEKKGGS